MASGIQVGAGGVQIGESNDIQVGAGGNQVGSSGVRVRAVAVGLRDKEQLHDLVVEDEAQGLRVEERRSFPDR